jgi:amino acid permease
MKITTIAIGSLMLVCITPSLSLSASLSSKKIRKLGDELKLPKAIVSITSDELQQVQEAVSTKDDGKASVPSEIFSLAKTIVGASCFGLPAAIATFGNAPSAVLPAAAVIAFTGLLSGYGFSLIGRVCAYTGSKSYKEAWANTVSPQSAWTVSAFSILVCLSGLLAYTMVLTDTAIKLFSAASIVVSKPQALATLMIGTLLPLCRLKKLSRLAPFAMAGIGAMLYTVAVMGLRYVQGAYSVGGTFYSAATTGSFGSIGAVGIFNPGAFVLISMLATAFSSHYNAPKFYNELRNNTIPRFNTVVSCGFGLAGLLYILVASFGFLTFGSNSLPMILQNYATQDTLVNVARLAVSLSIVTSYPLTFTGVRDSVLDLVGVKDRSNRVQDLTTVGLLTTLSILSLVVSNLGAVWAIGGATYGTALTVIIPPLMFIRCALKNKHLGLKKEIPVAVGTMTLGILMSIIGTIRAVQRFRVV